MAVKEKLEKVANNVKAIPVVNKIPGVNQGLDVLVKVGEFVDQLNVKREKIKELEEQVKKDKEVAHKIEMITKNSSMTEEQKDRELKKHFDVIFGR